MCVCVCGVRRFVRYGGVWKSCTGGSVLVGCPRSVQSQGSVLVHI